MNKIHQTLFKNLFQISSDLHINRFNYQIKFKPHSPHLLIAGDLDDGVNSKTKQYLRKLAENYDTITIIPGNHDLFGCTTLQIGLAEFKQIEKVSNNIKVLINDTQTFKYQIENQSFFFNILGCILWSELPKQHWNHYKIINWKIKNNQGLQFTPQDHNQCHHYDINWLRNEQLKVKYQNTNQNQFNIVMTHYPPLIEGTCKEFYYQSPKKRLKYFNHSFCTDLESKLLSPKLLPDSWKVWIFGHTHFPSDFWYQNRINLLSNPFIGKKP